MRRAVGALLLALLPVGRGAHGEISTSSRPDAIAAMRSDFAEIGRLLVEREAGRYPPPDRPPRFVHRDEALKVELRQAIRPWLEAAIEQAIRDGSREEQIGAWGMYGEFLYHHQIRRREDYHPILLNRLAEDDLTLPPYTGTLVGVITQYPSKATLDALIDLADRIPTLKGRYRVLALTADMLGGDVPIYQDTPEAQEQKILADFLAYLHENRDRIRFDRHGRAHLPGGPREGKPKSLTAEDRRRVREDPVCVLRLLHESFVETTGAESFEALVNRCGEALFGVKGVALMRELAAVPDGEGPSVDLQMRLAAVYGTHPVNDAAILAAACVAAYRREPELLAMAAEVLEMVGGVERVDQVTRGEPREVREGGAQLARRIAGR